MGNYITNINQWYIWMLPSGVNMENPPVSSRMLQLWTSNCVRGFALFFLKGIGFSSCTYYPCYCIMYLPTCLVTFPGKCSGTMVIFPWMIGGVYWFSFPIKKQILWWVWWSGTCQAIFLGVDFLTLALTLDIIYIYVYTSTLLNINSVYSTVSYIYIHQ